MNIEDLRNQINETDNQIVKGFEKRMGVAKEIAKWKQENDKPVYDKSRENDVLERVAGMVGNDLNVYVKSLYSTIFSLSRSYQLMQSKEETELTEMIKSSVMPSDKKPDDNSIVACQGIDGAYSQIACKKMFASPDIMYFRNFSGVFKAVESGLCKYGILPIENSSYGSVTQVYDLMRRHNFYVVKSVKLRINHELLAKEKTRLTDIKEVYSHEQAIGQCSEFLNGLEGVKVYKCENTAVAARMASESGRDDVAAISSEDCSKIYGLDIVKRKIQNTENNYTRFICISKDLEIYSESDKISLILSVAHRPGALFEVMSLFSSQGVNLTKLESRPIEGTDFEFMFYFDFEGDACSQTVLKLLGNLKKQSEKFVFLGNYSEIRE